MGSRVRNYRIAEALARRFELVCVTQVHDAARLDDPGPVSGLGRWVPVLAPHRRGPLSKLAWHARARWAAARQGLHRETFFQSLPELSRVVAREVTDTAPALVHVAYWYTLRHLRHFPRPPRWVVDTHDVQFDRHQRLWGRDSPRERREELAQLARYDDVVAITPRDRELFITAMQSSPRPGPSGNPPDEAPRLHVIPMGPDLEHWTPAAAASRDAPEARVAFYGNLSSAHNAEAARHLVREIGPALAAQVPGVEFTIIGADPPPAVTRLASTEPPRVEVTGFVDDPRPWLSSAQVLALSLRSGSGQRGRVLEALALGVPVVGYAEAFEGLDLAEGEGIRIVRSPEAFASALAALLGDRAQARALGERGRLCTIERYDYAATYGRFVELYERWITEDQAAVKGGAGR